MNNMTIDKTIQLAPSDTVTTVKIELSVETSTPLSDMQERVIAYLNKLAADTDLRSCECAKSGLWNYCVCQTGEQRGIWKRWERARGEEMAVVRFLINVLGIEPVREDGKYRLRTLTERDSNK